MDNSTKEQLVEADLPRSDDPQGNEAICSAEHPYDKYPPFSRGRIMLGLALLLGCAILAGLGLLIDEYL